MLRKFHFTEKALQKKHDSPICKRKRVICVCDKDSIIDARKSIIYTRDIIISEQKVSYVRKIVLHLQESIIYLKLSIILEEKVIYMPRK